MLVPQAAVQQGEGGNTYVLRRAHGGAPAAGPPRQVRDLGPVSWFFYTVLWRWPLLVGDAVLTVVWRGMTRLFGFNGGPSIQRFDHAHDGRRSTTREDLPSARQQERF